MLGNVGDARDAVFNQKFPQGRDCVGTDAFDGVLFQTRFLCGEHRDPPAILIAFGGVLIQNFLRHRGGEHLGRLFEEFVRRTVPPAFHAAYDGGGDAEPSGKFCLGQFGFHAVFPQPSGGGRHVVVYHVAGFDDSDVVDFIPPSNHGGQRLETEILRHPGQNVLAWAPGGVDGRHRAEVPGFKPEERFQGRKIGDLFLAEERTEGFRRMGKATFFRHGGRG